MQINTELVTFMIIVICALAGLWFRIENRIKIAEKRAEDALHLAETRLDTLTRDLTEHKLEVVRNYASVDHLKEVETRLADAINRLSSQLEKMPDKMTNFLEKYFDKKSG